MEKPSKSSKRKKHDSDLTGELVPVDLPQTWSNWFVHDLKEFLLERSDSSIHKMLGTDAIEPHLFRISFLDGRPIQANRKLADIAATTSELSIQRISLSVAESEAIELRSMIQLLRQQVIELKSIGMSQPSSSPLSSMPVVAGTAGDQKAIGAPHISSGDLQKINDSGITAILNRLSELEMKIDWKNSYFESALKELRLLTASVRAVGGVGAASVGRLQPTSAGQLDAAVPVRQPKGSLDAGHTGPVWTLAKTPFFFVGMKAHLRFAVWDLSSLKATRKLTGHTSIVHSLDTWGDNIISGSDDRTVRLWSARDGYKCNKIIRSKDIPSCLKVSNNLLFQGTYKNVRIYNLDSDFSLVKTIEQHNHWVRALAVVQGHLFSGSHGQIIQTDLATLKTQKTMNANCGSVYSIVVSDNLLYAATYENSIYIWDLRTYGTVRTFLGHLGAIYALAHHPSTGKLYSGSYDNTIRQWDLSTFSCTARLEGHTGSVESMQVVGDTLFSASRDSMINYWKL